MAVKREATPQGASSFLAAVFEQTEHHLDIFQSLSDFVEGVKTHQGAPSSKQRCACSACGLCPIRSCAICWLSIQDS